LNVPPGPVMLVFTPAVAEPLVLLAPKAETDAVMEKIADEDGAAATVMLGGKNVAPPTGVTVGVTKTLPLTPLTAATCVVNDPLVVAIKLAGGVSVNA
jgi:hypothetical protein